MKGVVVLPATQRLRSRADFTEVLRRGRRSRSPLLALHLLPGVDPADRDPAETFQPSRAGLIVSREVGHAVARHRVSRRLRHLLRDRMVLLAPGSRLVVRASSSSGDASSSLLARDLDAALSRLGVRG